MRLQIGEVDSVSELVPLAERRLLDDMEPLLHASLDFRSSHVCAPSS